MAREEKSKSLKYFTSQYSNQNDELVKLGYTAINQNIKVLSKVNGDL